MFKSSQKILCHIFESEKSILSLKLTEHGIGDVPRKVLLRTALSGVICHGTTKGRLPLAGRTW